MREKVLIIIALVFAMPLATVVAFHPNDDCDSCHLPHEDLHGVDGGLDGMPLWAGIKTAATSFVVYDSATLDADPGDPAGPTLVCLACHDGSHGPSHQIAQGGDISGTHPMEFVYDQALATLDGELVDPTIAGSSTVVGGEHTIDADLLTAGVLNCQSCHEIHINGLHTETVSPPDPLLADFQFDIPHLVDIPGIEHKTGWGGDPNNSGDYELSYGVLCTTCHIK